MNSGEKTISTTVGKLKQLERRTAKEVHRIKWKEAQQTLHIRIQKTLHPGYNQGGIQSNVRALDFKPPITITITITVQLVAFILLM
jgi:hypothetical protein